MLLSDTACRYRKHAPVQQVHAFAARRLCHVTQHGRRNGVVRAALQQLGTAAVQRQPRQRVLEQLPGGFLRLPPRLCACVERRA
eukprot:354078-Chlamydomonas_euryale.AAC.6